MAPLELLAGADSRLDRGLLRRFARKRPREKELHSFPIGREAGSFLSIRPACASALPSPERAFWERSDVGAGKAGRLTAWADRSGRSARRGRAKSVRFRAGSAAVFSAYVFLWPAPCLGPVSFLLGRRRAEEPQAGESRSLATGIRVRLSGKGAVANRDESCSGRLKDLRKDSPTRAREGGSRAPAFCIFLGGREGKKAD